MLYMEEWHTFHLKCRWAASGITGIAGMISPVPGTFQGIARSTHDTNNVSERSAHLLYMFRGRKSFLPKPQE